MGERDELVGRVDGLMGEKLQITNSWSFRIGRKIISSTIPIRKPIGITRNAIRSFRHRSSKRIDPGVAVPPFWHFPRNSGWLEHLPESLKIVTEVPLPDNESLSQCVEQTNYNDETLLASNKVSIETRRGLNSLRACLMRSTRAPSIDVLIDARCFDNEGLKSRGVGRHARSTVKKILNDLSRFESIVILSDSDKGWFEEAIFGEIFDISIVHSHEISKLAPPKIFLSLSPLTEGAVPEIVTHETYAIALLYDLIPLKNLTHYFSNFEHYIAYFSKVVWLRQFDEYWAISKSIAEDFTNLIGVQEDRIRVTGVDSPIFESVSPLTTGRVSPAGATEDLTGRSALLFGGGDARKNFAVPLQAAPKGTHFKVIGHLPDDVADDLRELSQTVGSSVEFLKEISDADLLMEVCNSSYVVVPSHDEGYSMPVDEAVRCGRTVLASDIPVHRELLGEGPWLVSPSNLEDWRRAMLQFTENGWQESQIQHLTSVRQRFDDPKLPPSGRLGIDEIKRRPKTWVDRPRIALYSPFPPMRSGVADYSYTLALGLDKVSEVILLTDDPNCAIKSGVPMSVRPIESAMTMNFDAILLAIGNSHFHIPMLEFLEQFGGSVIAHDDRMSGLYYHWLGWQETEKLLFEKPRDDKDRLEQSLTDVDIADFRGYSTISSNADQIFVHGSQICRAISAESACQVHQLPFMVYGPWINKHLVSGTFPEYEMTDSNQKQNRDAGNEIRIATVGEVSIGFKRLDLILESLLWIKQRGYNPILTVIGGGPQSELDTLTTMIKDLGLAADVRLMGFVTEEAMLTELRRSDVAIQLRNSPALTLSGAALNVIVAGTALVTTAAIAYELNDAPNIYATPNDFSAHVIAEKVLEAFSSDESYEKEAQRLEFLRNRWPTQYVQSLLTHLSV